MQARRTRTGVRLFISLLLLVFFGAHSSGWFPMRMLAQADRYAYDARVQLTMPGDIDPRVIIVDVDEKSLAVQGHWPWSRDKLALLLHNLFEQYRIRVLGLDFVFPEADRAPGLALLDELGNVPGAEQKLTKLRRDLDTDGKFAEALAKYPVIMGYVFDPVHDQHKGVLAAPMLDAKAAADSRISFLQARGYFANIERLQSRAIGGGFFDNPALDGDGVFRRVPLMQSYGGTVYPSLAFAVTRLALGNPPVDFIFDPPDARGSLYLEAVRLGPLRVPVDEDVAMLVPYRGPQRSFPYVSASDVINGVADPAVLKPGSIALLGTSASALFDLRVTPFSKAYVGVEIHANLISGMLDGRVKQRPSYYIGMELLMLMIISIVLALWFPRLSPLAGAALVLTLLAAVFAIALAGWEHENLITPMGVPLLFTVSLFLAQMLYGFFVESRSLRSLTRQFGEYVPPEIVAEMADNPERVSMEGEARDMTVLFSDVRGFTSISEKLEAKELSVLMNEFLTPLTKVIHKHRGTIDKYMGDAVMAFWGAPLPDQERASNALEAGFEMLQAVRDLDAPFAERGWPPINIGVGLNSGTMRVGNMGSEFRRAYTVMGDAVNLGSRLESLTKEYGVGMICSDHTRKAAPAGWAFRELDAVRVKGKNEPVAIFEPLGPAAEVPPEYQEELQRHAAALHAYRAQNWDEAEAAFTALAQSGKKIYQLFLDRIAGFREQPPEENWDGAWNWEHK